MDVHELYKLIEAHYGYKADMLCVNTENKEVEFWLYNSFFIKCNLDERYNSFGAGIMMGNQQYTITEFLGSRCSLNSDVRSIKQSLSTIENYCRLRLPDKFLQAFEKAYKK